MSMNTVALTYPEMYAWILLPLLIFFARVCDVSLGTIRIIFIAKGIKYLAPMVGFFEILVWLLAIGQIMQNLTNIYYYIFYAGGFATGNLVGMILEEKLSIGLVAIRIITRRDATKLIEAMKKEQCGVTVVNAEGMNTKKVKLIFSVIQRQHVHDIITLVKRFNPKAFYSIEDIRYVQEAVISPRKLWYKPRFLSVFSGGRKGK